LPDTPDPRFELRAELTYAATSGSGTGTHAAMTDTEIFAVSFDWKTKTKQFASLPISFRKDADGRDMRPISIKVIADYSGNANMCHFSKPSLTSEANWTYMAMDCEDRKIFECTNRKISDMTLNGSTAVNGIESDKFITYAESSYEYDRKGNLVKETALTERDGKDDTYVTIRC
jgi:hypothetical protein